jgi:translocation and assembly module TamA
LNNWLSIQPADDYKQSSFGGIERRINDLNFLTLKSAPSVAFVNNLARVSLELEEERVSTFDGVIGFLQNQGDNKLTITGIVDLELYNLFGTGQELELHWQQQKELSQSLNLGYAHPQLFKSVLGLKLDYNQLKEDTTFINRNFSFGLTLPLKPARVHLYYTRSSGRILAAQIENPLQPNIADFNVDMYNINLTFGQFSGRIEDRGWQFDITTSIGDKRILRNPIIDDEYYNSSDLRTTQYSFVSVLQWQVPIGEHFRLYQRLTFNKLVSDQLFLNDLYRFGGLNSQRGFNELEFFADQYVLSNLELRWLWSEKSYLFTFYDQSIYQIDINSVKQSDHPLGLGLGLTLSTETGLFKLVYALGQSTSQPIAFNQAKIHFGFTSRF